MDQNIDSSGFDQIQPSQYLVIHHPSQEMSEKVLQAKENLMKSIQTFLEKFNRISFGEMPKVLLIAWERFSEIKHAFINKQYQPEEIQELMCKLLEDVQNIDEELSEYINSPKNSSNAIAPVLPTEEPEYSLSMGYEHPSTIPKTESDEVIKSSAKNLVLIPSECEVTSDNESEYDLPVCKDHSKILSDSNNDDISSDDDAFEDIEYVKASLPDSEYTVLREKLLSINRHIANIEFLNDNPIPDRVLKSSSSFPIFEKFDNSLSYSDNSLPEFETFSDHTEETKSGSTNAHANNSLPEYDSFCFEIEPDQDRFTSVVMNDIFDNSTNDPLLEEVDLFLASNNSIPSELLSNDSIPLPKNDSLNFDHHDDPSCPHPPPEPLHVEVFFDFEPDSGKLISAVMNNIDELNEDECFDPGGEIDVFANIKDDDYFPIIFVIQIFLPYLIYPEVSPLLLSNWSEDTIFDPGISI
uniref:Reverse transcriptase domain-containing protein n=1 Tax=Tanacetum cinerariifolium TaxID=118510 RepID=A0A6L2J295_TANCI|nr:hypothetical protein [Tanacetum cinerariifolium]